MKNVLKISLMLIISTILFSCADNENENLPEKQAMLITDDFAGKTVFLGDYSDIDFSALSIGQFVYVDNSPSGFENSVKIKVERTEDGIGIYKPEIYDNNVLDKILINFSSNNELITSYSKDYVQSNPSPNPQYGADGLGIWLLACCTKITIQSGGGWTYTWDCSGCLTINIG